MKILLRTLTEDSIVGIGALMNYTVKDAIIAGKAGKLLYCYYYYNNISFTPFVLDKLHVPLEWRIGKPGKNTDIFLQAMKNYYNKENEGLTKEQRLKNWSVKMSFKKRKAKNTRLKSAYSPGRLQFINQHI